MSLTPEQIRHLIDYRHKGETWESISKRFQGYTANAIRHIYRRNIAKPRVKLLLMDIETAPILAHVWKIWDQNIGLNQIIQDWSILSWSAKWFGSNKIFYMDNRCSKDVHDDKKLLLGAWDLMNEADIIIWHNGKKFDNKKLRARFLKHKITPPNSYRQIDTLDICKKNFDLTSNKLEYVAEYLNVKHKKLKHSKYSGHTLWLECLKGNLDAWNQMELYNKNDVIVLEEVYKELRVWDNSINFNVYHDSMDHVCSCGNHDLQLKPNDFIYTNTGKFNRLICKSCGKEYKSKQNLLSLEKRKVMPK